MNKLIRFGVSMENDLLTRFDRLIETMGYTNRSEAIRDIVRNKLIEDNVEHNNAAAFGVITFVYDHHKHELEFQLTHFQHDHFKNIVSSTHVHIDHENCLETVIVKGKAKLLKSLAQQIFSFKGVKYGKLTLTSA